jgi:hypothetical protein
MMILNEQQRDVAVSALVDNDFDSIMNGDSMELLNSYLMYGHKGYNDYTNDELVSELQARDMLNILDSM